ncbi:MAG: hypothetical protein V2J02_17305 [Pseudomonadales bacterium]|jgi:hypothetical protein|nr:hypothetical protein [Pseudomonadales bacterium]
MQLALDFEPGRTRNYPTCREYVQARVHQQKSPQKAIAADMDYSPSHLSRKLSQHPDDSARFTLDDLETYVRVTGDTEPVLWLVEKYLVSEQNDRIAELEAELARLKGVTLS